MHRFFNRSTAWPYLAALLAVWVLFFWQYYIPGPARVTFPNGDFTNQFYVFRDIAYRALAAGHWPGWANCFFAGYPFQADPQSQLFYAPIWMGYGALKLLGWGNFPIFALTVETTLHYWAASVLLFFFLRRELGDDPAAVTPRSIAALLGAVTFTYSGYLTGYPPLQTAILETVTWLPLILLLLNRLASAQANQWRWTILAALVLALAFFAGHPQTFLFIVYLSAVYFLYRASLSGRPWRWRITHLVVIYAALFGLSLVQLLPQAQYLTLSNRSGITFDELAHGFPPGIIVQFFITDPVWSPLYIGVLPLVLASVAVIGYRNRPVLFWLAVGVVGYLLALGGNTPLYTVAYWVLPGYRLFRDQERLALLVAFAIAMLAAYGTLWLLTQPKAQTLRTVQIVAAVVGVGMALALWQTYNPAQANWQPRAVLSIVAFAASLVVLFANWLPVLNATVWGGALVAVIGLNLWAARTPTNTVPDFEAYPYYSILDPIQADAAPFFRVQDDAQMQGHFACGYGLSEWAGISPIRPAAWVTFDQRALESLRWKLLGIKYLITWKNGALTREEELPPAERVAEGASPNSNDTKVYRLFEIPKRAWLVYTYHGESDSAALFQQINDPGFDPFSQAVLRSFDTIPAITDPQAENAVTVVEDWPGHLSLQVDTPNPGLLVVSEAYYPGWAATVNGRATPVYEADGFLQALAVPAGQSRVNLNFQPILLTIGAIGSLVTLVICLAILLVRKPVPTISA